MAKKSAKKKSPSKLALPLNWKKESASIFCGEMLALRDDNNVLWARVEKYGMTGSMFRWIVEDPDSDTVRGAGYASDYATGQAMATIFLLNQWLSAK